MRSRLGSPELFLPTSNEGLVCSLLSKDGADNSDIMSFAMSSGAALGAEL